VILKEVKRLEEVANSLLFINVLERGGGTDKVERVSESCPYYSIFLRQNALPMSALSW
jgi:hypothetical protein